MKIVNVAIVLGIFVSAAISSVAVMGLGDSTDDGIIDSGGLIAKTQDKVVALAFANLNVQAEGNAANAYPGDTGNANILVLVTNKGAPVEDLKKDNFKLKTIFVPPGGGAVKVTDFYNYGKGAYTFSVVPIEGVTWGAGEYDIQIRVTRGGQTIASIEVGY